MGVANSTPFIAKIMDYTNTATIFQGFINPLGTLISGNLSLILGIVAGLTALCVLIAYTIRWIGAPPAMSKSFKKTVYIDGVSEFKGRNGSYIYKDF